MGVDQVQQPNQSGLNTVFLMSFCWNGGLNYEVFKRRMTVAPLLCFADATCNILLGSLKSFLAVFF
jgi:hypothetical protein